MNNLKKVFVVLLYAMTIFFVLGMAILRFVCAELTEAQMVVRFWPLWGFGIGLAAAVFFVNVKWGRWP